MSSTLQLRPKTSENSLSSFQCQNQLRRRRVGFARPHTIKAAARSRCRLFQRNPPKPAIPPVSRGTPCWVTIRPTTQLMVLSQKPKPGVAVHNLDTAQLFDKLAREGIALKRVVPGRAGMIGLDACIDSGIEEAL